MFSVYLMAGLTGCHKSFHVKAHQNKIHSNSFHWDSIPPECLCFYFESSGVSPSDVRVSSWALVFPSELWSLNWSQSLSSAQSWASRLSAAAAAAQRDFKTHQLELRRATNTPQKKSLAGLTGESYTLFSCLVRTGKVSWRLSSLTSLLRLLICCRCVWCDFSLLGLKLLFVRMTSV